MVRLFTAKAQMFRMHGGRTRGWWGVRLLDLWALLRLAGLKVLGRRESYAQWRDTWRRRGSWHAGFADAPDLKP